MVLARGRGEHFAVGAINHHVARVRHAWTHQRRLSPPNRRGVGADELGASIMYFPAEIRNDVDGIWSEIVGYDQEMWAQMDRLGCKPTKVAPNQSADCTRLYEYWKGPWSTFVNAFSAFRTNHQSWWDNFWGLSTFDQIQQWRGRLLREFVAARVAGFTFTRPDPTPPEQNIFQRVSSPIAKIYDDLLGILKWILIAAGGVAAFVLLRDFVIKPGGATRIARALPRRVRR